jgi:cytochrome c551/c552
MSKQIGSLRSAVGVLVWILAMPLAAAADSAATTEARALLTQYRCYVCHDDRDTVTGPAFADVAAQLHGQRSAVSDIAQAIRQGVRRGGPWHMPPHPEVSRTEANAMARYIMSLATESPAPPGAAKP